MHHYALMLAAGAASRMGRCKALLPLPFPDGDCCALERLARMYAFCGQRFVVTGHHAGLLEPVAPGWGLRAVRNPRPEDGMFSSICAGLQAVLEQARADGVEPEQGGVFVHPVDVPLTRRLTLLALLRTADAVPGTALQAAFCGEPGHPVYLPLSLVPAILAHDGREGLRGALASVPCRQVPVADAAMLLDMDTPEQYADLQDRAACHDALTRDEAEGLLLQAGVPERGLRHALAVGRVAEALCAALTEARGEKALVETALALASGLTHDICKGVHGHEAAGGRLLARLGLARMAAIGIRASRRKKNWVRTSWSIWRTNTAGAGSGCRWRSVLPRNWKNSALIRAPGPVSKGGATGHWLWNGGWPWSWAVTPPSWHGKCWIRRTSVRARGCWMPGALSGRRCAR